jgi:phosphonate dehydrogenase
MTKPRIVVTNQIFPETRALLEGYATLDVNPSDTPWPRDELIARAQDADGLMIFMTDMIDAAFIEACPRLRVIGAALKGYDNIDVDACTRAGVRVTIVPDLLTVPTAELAIGLMLALGRNILTGDRMIREHGFSGWRPTLYGSGIANATVGIWGFGLVGQAIAARLAAFNCSILAADDQQVAVPHHLEGKVLMVDIDRVVGESDYLVLALPLTLTTQHLVNSAIIARMKPGSRIINPARGSLVDESAIADALEAGHLAGYAADVFECEDWARLSRPSVVEPRLRHVEARTVLTPHIGSAVTSVRREIELSAARSLIDAMTGRALRHAINHLENNKAQNDDQPDAGPNVSHGR